MARTLDSGTNRKSKGTEMKRWTMSAVLALTTAWGVAAQAAYPDRPVRLVVPFGAGASRTSLRARSARVWATRWASRSWSRTGPARAG